MKTEVVLNRAAELCADHGSKLTPKRRQVLTGLVKSQKALSAYDLADYCRDRLGASLLPMSVYRILEFLQSIGLVHRLNTANKYVACAHITCNHTHDIPQFLICKGCSTVKEVGITKSLIKGISKAVESVGFHLVNNQLELECLCSDCATQARLPK
ncbi:MAG: transcriptional repressor [Proteobacteria bacterium]|nr:transcriptional repressor [Pseudomonadota bacterium]